MQVGVTLTEGLPRGYAISLVVSPSTRSVQGRGPELVTTSVGRSRGTTSVGPSRGPLSQGPTIFIGRLIYSNYILQGRFCPSND